MKARPFGKFSRYAPSYPPTVYFVLLRRTRIQQATSRYRLRLFPPFRSREETSFLSARSRVGSLAGVAMFPHTFFP